MASKRILIVDDEENIGRSLRMILEREGYAVNFCRSVAEFTKHPDAGRADAYLLDMKLPDGSGIDLLQGGQAEWRRGARHHDLRPRHHRRRGGSHARRRLRFPGEAAQPRPRAAGREACAWSTPGCGRRTSGCANWWARSPKMIGSSPAWQRAVEQASMAARSDARVLLIGESGTGKELLAAHIHNIEPVRGGPVRQGELRGHPDRTAGDRTLRPRERDRSPAPRRMRRGKFELADGGTIFLDEVGDLHGASQAKLLRVLQEGEFHRVGGEQIIRVSVRVVSATNRDLAAMVAAEKFREDLYYRLSVVPIRVPALRERPHDIRLLAEYFLEEFCARNNFKRKVLDETRVPAAGKLRLAGQRARTAQRDRAHGDSDAAASG